MTARWLADAKMADSTRAMRKSIVDRDILPAFKNRLLNEITADDLRALCNKVKARGAPRHRGPRPRHREAGLRLRHPARREGGQPGRWRGRGFDRDLRAEGSSAVAAGDPSDVRGRWSRWPPIRPSAWRCA
jgi:hypothetical protein